MRAIALLAALFAAPAQGETLVATRTIRAHAIIAPGDVTVVAAAVPGTLSDPADALGQEARVAIYQGRPLRAGDIGPPALVERNQIVELRFRSGPLDIRTEGRALMRGGEGDAIRVLNVASRSTVNGRVLADGTVAVGPMP